MTQEEQQEFLRAVAIYVREEVRAAVQQELSDFRFMGTWEDGRTYRQHNTVHYGGSTWLCICEATTVRPSTDEPLSWALIAKRGRDGKDVQRSPSYRSNNHV